MKAVLAALAMLAITGCTLTHAAVEAPVAAKPTSSVVATASCALRGGDADVEVAIRNSLYSCGQWVSWLAPVGLNWLIIPAIQDPYTPGPADGESLYKVCVLSAGMESMTVEDAGSAIYGTSICSQEEANGWVPHESTDG